MDSKEYQFDNDIVEAWREFNGSSDNFSDHQNEKLKKSIECQLVTHRGFEAIKSRLIQDTDYFIRNEHARIVERNNLVPIDLEDDRKVAYLTTEELLNQRKSGRSGPILKDDR